MNNTEARNDAPDPVDSGALLERCMGDATVAALLLTKLETQLIHDLGVLEVAVPNRDADSTAKIAHALKGAAGAVAAESLRTIAASMETSAKQGALAGAAEELVRLRDEVHRCIAFLPEARERMGCGTAGSAEPGRGSP